MALVRGDQITGSVALAARANSASYAESAATASLADSAQTASYVLVAQSALTANTANTASYTLFAATASYVVGGISAGDRITSGIVEAVVSTVDNVFLINSGSATFFNIDTTGSTTVTSNANNPFLIKNFGGKTLLKVSQSGVVTLATQSTQLTDPAPIGGIYFTSNSFFVGLD